MNIHQFINIAVVIVVAAIGLRVQQKTDRELDVQRKSEADEDAAVEAADADEAEELASEINEEIEEALSMPAINVVVPSDVTIH